MILIFAGAGASYAISPERYPTTEAFYSNMIANKHIGNIIQNALEGYLHRIISEEENKNGKITDIEKILAYITRFKYDLNLASDRKRVSYEFVRSKKAIDRNVCSSAVDELNMIEKEIHLVIHNTYGKFDTEDCKLWSQFIERFIGTEASDIIEIFTTNYDPIIEETINADRRKGNKIDTGIKLDGRGRSYFDYSFSEVGNSSYLGRFTKLHGSINWKNEGDKIFIATDDSVPHKDYIIYPNLENKGIPSDGCFRSMHDHLSYVCSRADVAIFVGFSFRDTYINQVLRSISDQTVKIVINKDSMESTLHEDFPFRAGTFEHIGDGFSEPSINKMTNYLQKLADEGVI